MLQRKDIHFSILEEDIYDIYVHVEPINFEYEYDDQIFIHDFGRGDKTYKWVFHEYKNKGYVAAKEIPTRQEYIDLQKICRCERCVSKWFDICSKLKKDTGCLKDNNFSQKVLNDTRNYQHNLNFM